MYKRIWIVIILLVLNCAREIYSVRGRIQKKYQVEDRYYFCLDNAYIIQYKRDINVGVIHVCVSQHQFTNYSLHDYYWYDKRWDQGAGWR